MSKTPKPLRYVVHSSLADTDEIKKRISQGHDIIIDHNLQGPDLVIGPNAFRISVETIHLLPLAEQAARETKYGKTVKGKK